MGIALAGVTLFSVIIVAIYDFLELPVRFIVNTAKDNDDE